MSRLLEILGGAIAVDVADVIWHWLDAAGAARNGADSIDARELQKIIELIGQQKFETAEQQVRFYLFENPSCVYGRMAAAAICLHNNKLQAAIEELNSIYFRHPNNTMALYALGHCYERLSQEQQAIEFYQDCLKFKNYLQLPAERLAAIYFKNRQIEKAVEQYELLQCEYPDDIEVRVTLGYLHMAAGDYDKAAKAFDTAILIHPDNFQGYDSEIDTLLQQGQVLEALECCEDLAGTQPHRIDLLVKRADMLTMLGSTSDAVAQYEEVLRLCPDSLEATIKLGTLYLQTGHEVRAAEHFNKAAEVNDRIVDAYTGLAAAHKMAGRTSEALSTLALAGAIQPNTCLLFAEVATLHFHTVSPQCPGQSSQNDRTALMAAAIHAHRTELTRCPNNPDIYYRLGILHAATGQLNAAISSFRKALDLNPLFARARTKLAVCQHEIGNRDAALKNLPTSEHLDDQILRLHYETALLYCDRVKFASSLLNLNRILEDNLASADTTTNISITLQNLGLVDRAAASWESVARTASEAQNRANPPL